MSGFDPTLVTSGLMLVIAGALLAYVRSVPGVVYRYVKSRFIFSVDVLQTDEAFGWLIGWLNQHPSVQRSKRLALHSRYSDGAGTEITYTPLGVHWLRHNGRLVWFQRNREPQRSDGMMTGMWETITVSTLSRRRGLIESLVSDAKALHEDARKGKVLLSSLSQYGDWVEIARKEPRPIDSVVLPPAAIAQTLGDLREFAARRDWYRSLGVPYRRGYLLYGPPGNGKSSLVFAVASEMKRDLALISLGMPSLTDDALRSAIARMPANAILLIEDIDGVFNQREPASKDMKLTFSGLLNALDGVATADGRVMFVTTNHIERLDPALIRPGRIDVRVEIDKPAVEQVAALYGRFFPDRAFQPDAIDGLSMAAYQERFLQEMSHAR